MPSNEKNPSRVPMWRGIKVAYFIVSLCLFPLAIGGYWAYGHKVNNKSKKKKKPHTHLRHQHEYINYFLANLIFFNPKKKKN